MPDPICTLLADVGGTHTRIALAQDGRLRTDTIRRLRNENYPALEPMLRDYLSESGAAPVGACVAAAGPVRGDSVSMTNLAWTIAPGAVGAATGAGTVAILNDLQAQAHALSHLAHDALRPVLPGKPAAPGATALVIGVGTGFNSAVALAANGLLVVPPAESGQITLPVTTQEDLRMSQFLAARSGHACVEDALSGRGLAYLYEFAAQGTGLPALPAADIIAALDAGDPTARRAAGLFVRMLGAVAGDLALLQLPFGGVFLAGGVARALAPHYAALGFAEGFHAKGRFSDLMASFPVAVIEDDYAALAGCAGHLATLLTNSSVA